MAYQLQCLLRRWCLPPTPAVDFFLLRAVRAARGDLGRDVAVSRLRFDSAGRSVSSFMGALRFGFAQSAFKVERPPQKQAMCRPPEREGKKPAGGGGLVRNSVVVCRTMRCDSNYLRATGCC